MQWEEQALITIFGSNKCINSSASMLQDSSVERTVLCSNLLTAIRKPT
jgi:hypothetical protein